MKLGLKRVDRTKELLTMFASEQGFEIFEPQQDVARLFVSYIDRNGLRKHCCYELDGSKDEDVKYVYNFSNVSSPLVAKKCIREFFQQPFTPDEWLASHSLIELPKSALFSYTEYCLVPKDRVEEKNSFYFTYSSPLTRVSKIGCKLEIASRLKQGSKLDDVQAKSILDKVAAKHERTVNQMRPGDVIFTNNSQLSNVDKKVLPSGHEGFSHVAIFGSHGLIVEATLEKGFKGSAREMPAALVLDCAKNGYAVVRAMPDAVIDPAVDLAPTLFDKGKKYSLWSLVLPLINSVTNCIGITPFSGQLAPETFICTQYVNYILRSYSESPHSLASLESTKAERIAELKHGNEFSAELDYQSPNIMYNRYCQAGMLEFLSTVKSDVNASITVE
ncbi:hypothetical protein AB4354_23695 [Vibrio splendidus]|uniref:hypothetical protein n=1 Tax=Vibrio splendidus TaxID=29497 RepID=UPI000C8493CC|nr:hypothetical protein [Vibrio splendidus]PMH06860.1 hypothetical protein BCU75_19950 [Vibrio splendidus]